MIQALDALAEKVGCYKVVLFPFEMCNGVLAEIEQEEVGSCLFELDE